MSGRRKLEGEVEVRESARDVIHDIVNNKPHNISHAASHFINGVDLHEGNHGQLGCKTIWNYTLEGKPMKAKAVLEEINEEKKYAKYQVIEGDLMKDYKNFTAAVEVIPKDSETCVVKATYEYEKMHPGIPEPTTLMDSWLDALNHVDDHHHGKKK